MVVLASLVVGQQLAVARPSLRLVGLVVRAVGLVRPTLVVVALVVAS